MECRLNNNKMRASDGEADVTETRGGKKVFSFMSGISEIQGPSVFMKFRMKQSKSIALCSFNSARTASHYF